jgi:hypothetical protein
MDAGDVMVAAELRGSQDWNPSASERLENRCVAAAEALLFALAGVPKRFHVDGAKPGDQATEVVRMRVCQDRGEDILATACAKLRGEQPRADVDWAPDEATAIDDHRSAIRKVDDGRVALSDVEEGDAKLAPWGSGAHGGDFEPEHDGNGREDRRPTPRPKQCPRCQCESDHDELPRRRLGDGRGNGWSGEADRNAFDEDQGARGDDRAPAFCGRPPRERGMDEA